MNPLLGPRFDAALQFASELHREQTRRGSGIPYVTHLMTVASLVLEHGGDEDAAIAALLHDAVEDQGGEATRTEIEQRFGRRVTELVDAGTDTDVTPKPPWRPRKEAALARIRGISDPDARLVIAADKLHNTRCLLDDLRERGDELWQLFRGGRDGSLWYYRSAVDALRTGELTPGGIALVAKLERQIDELERLASRHCE